VPKTSVTFRWPATRRTGGVHEALRRGQRRHPGSGRPDVLGLRQDDGQVLLLLRDGGLPAVLAVNDRYRRPPVPLPRHQSVVQPVLRPATALPRVGELGDDGLARVNARHPGEPIGVDQHAVGLQQVDLDASGHGVSAEVDDDLRNRQAEPGGKIHVPPVMRRNPHHHAGAVVGQHVVGDQYRNLGTG
jgi:hypothetical protein